jgi:hypothetical protein
MIDVYAQCETNLRELARWYQERVGSRNEATTRLHLIDRLFQDCLAWTRDDITAEESSGGQYADYTFLAPRRVLIVEAKKEGTYFEVPAGVRNLEYPLKTLRRVAPEVSPAIEQAASYCQQRGVPLGAVCNGHQLIAFVATRNDGIPPLDGRALVFSSLEFMLERFSDLWQALSKPGVQEQRLLRRLLGAYSAETPPKLSVSIPGYPGIKQRNPYQTDLQIVSELIFEDITRSRDLEARFLAECYCQSGALSQYALVSKTILKARYQALFDASTPGPTPIPAVDKDGISADLLAESLSRRPILILGDVGVGKTTFIRYLVKVDGAPLFDKAIVLYVDLGTQATLTPQLREFVLAEMARQLRSTYDVDIEERNFVRGVYHFDLERFAHSFRADVREHDPDSFRKMEVEYLDKRVGDTEQHLRRVLEHLVKGRERQVVIFIDNADQREYAIQQEAFLIAQEMAEHWPATIFVALRPETFHRSARSGALSGYHPKAFTISPPRIDEVLWKRLQFALRITSGDIPVKRLAQVHLRVANLDAIIRAFLESISRNSELVECIDNICGGNVRAALDLVKGFFGSGHVDTEKIVKIFLSTGSYMIPLHEFLRAVIYGDSEYYDPTRSPLGNIFSVHHADPKEHFLLPIVLTFLIANEKEGSNAGFVATARVYEYAQGLGFVPEQIDAAIMRAHTHRLIQTAARREPYLDQPMPEALRATTVGAYHVQRLCRHFAYLDAVVVDTPILDSQTRAVIQDVGAIAARLERADVFRQYLDRQWLQLPCKHALFEWPTVSADLAADIGRIQRVLAERESGGR